MNQQKKLPKMLSVLIQRLQVDKMYFSVLRLTLWTSLFIVSGTACATSFRFQEPKLKLTQEVSCNKRKLIIEAMTSDQEIEVNAITFSIQNLKTGVLEIIEKPKQDAINLKNFRTLKFACHPETNWIYIKYKSVEDKQDTMSFTLMDDNKFFSGIRIQ